MRRRSTHTPRAVLLALFVFLVGVVPVAAQRPPAQRGQGRQDREQLERRVRARFGEMVKQRLGLDDDQARRLDDAVMGFQQDRMTLGREEQALRKRVETLLGDRSDDQSEARALLDRMQELRLQEARLAQREQEKLLEVLTAVQVLRFQALREEMGQRIQRLRGAGPPGRPRGPGGGVGGAEGRQPDRWEPWPFQER